MRDWNKASLQTIFNHISRHLLKQGKRSKYPALMDEEGNRCVIGCLYPKKDYNKNRCINYNKVRSLYDLNFNSWILIHDLRALHDYDSCNPSLWPGKLRKIARKYNLEIPKFLLTESTK